MMNVETNPQRTTPSKGGSAKKATKNAKITNFFTKVNSDQLTSPEDSSSMKAPLGSGLDEQAKKSSDINNKDYVFIIPSSDDETNASTTKRKRAPSVHSGNSKSSDGFVLINANNELGIARKKRVLDLMSSESNSSNNGGSSTPSQTPPRVPSRDSTPTNQSGTPRITRIQPTMIGCRTKTVDFQSVPSDLNLPRDQAQKLIEKLFFVRMPEDFFLFWDFAKTINHRKPCSAFRKYLGLWLVGPFDVMSGLISNFHGFSKENLLRHCRYYYDPPGFQTVIVKKDEFMTHYGYYRDEPTQENAIVVMNRAAVGAQIHEAGDNLFTLLRNELEASIATLSKASQEVPTFSSSSSRTPRSAKAQSEKQSQLEKARTKQELTIIRDKLLDFCSSHENLSSESWSRTNTRLLKRCGYHDLTANDPKFKALISGYSNDTNTYNELRQIIDSTLAIEDNNSPKKLELGLTLFYTGDSSFHSDIESLLGTSMKTEFFEILKAHLAERNQGDKVSLLD
uniref:UPF0609 protein C4orf27 n=1 Tax=Aceria tosichella TaxID=561515 RepID=A0A6G1SCD7_9ACAR